MLLLACLGLSNSASAQVADYSKPQSTSFGEWFQAKQGYWLGRIDNKAWWYRFNYDNTLSRSADARNWEPAADVVGKDNMGVIIRLTEDEVVTGENQEFAWVPIVNREWDKEKGLDYEVSHAPLIWSMAPPKLYSPVY